MIGAAIEPADPAVVKRLNEIEVLRAEAELARIHADTASRAVSIADTKSYTIANYAKSFMFVAVGVAALVVAL